MKTSRPNVSNLPTDALELSMRVTSKTGLIRPFNLIRWFSLTALASVAVVSALAAWSFSAFLTERMIRQEAEITAGFVRSIVAREDAYFHFQPSGVGAEQQSRFFLDHLNRLPGVLRTNVYSADRSIVWSSDRSLIGQRFAQNDELEEALRADLVVHSGIIDPAHLSKLEHLHLDGSANRFVESYVPVFDVRGRAVVGVVELYKVPTELIDAIEAGVRLIWIAAGLAGLFLCAALFWIVRRAHRIINAQGEQLVGSESLAVVGEMGSAVAHGLRNPLASIRSSAELSLESALPPEARECAQDVINQVDRLEGWIRQLLSYAKPDNANITAVDMNAVLQTALQTYVRDMERRGIKATCRLAPDLPPVHGDAPMLTQLIGSLIANAMEALPADETDGEIRISSQHRPDGMICAEIADNGPGIAPRDMARIFKPFFTSKTKGLGLGLPLVRRVVERLGDSVEVDSTPDAGTVVRLLLPPWKS